MKRLGKFFSHFPPEILIYKIFPFLNFVDYLRLSASNKAFYKAIITKNRVFKVLMKEEFGDEYYEIKYEGVKYGGEKDPNYYQNYKKLAIKRIADSKPYVPGIGLIEEKYRKNVKSAISKISKEIGIKKFIEDVQKYDEKVEGQLNKRMREYLESYTCRQGEICYKFASKNSGQKIKEEIENIFTKENMFVRLNCSSEREYNLDTDFYGDFDLYGYFVPRSKNINSFEDFLYYGFVSIIMERGRVNFDLINSKTPNNRRCRNSWCSIVDEFGCNVEEMRIVPFYEENSKVLNSFFFIYDGNTKKVFVECLGGFYYFKFFTS